MYLKEYKLSYRRIQSINIRDFKIFNELLKVNNQRTMQFKLGRIF